jgi:sugar phosphate isomerase/epimerase
MRATGHEPGWRIKDETKAGSPSPPSGERDGVRGHQGLRRGVSLFSACFVCFVVGSHLFPLAAFSLSTFQPGDVPSVPAPPSFFALCMDTHDAKKRSLEQQAELLKELGYDGAGHLWLDQVPERLKTLDAAGLKLWQIYIRLDLSPTAQQPYDPRLKDVLPLLKGRPTMLAALVTGGKPSDESLDARAVELLRRLADMAKPFGVKIALYPHAGDWLERVEDAIRITGKVDRENVGVMFNLCHWLRVDKQRNYRPLFEKAMPKLFAVSINGADEFDEQAGWSRYIQPLDRGSFDQRKFLGTLREIGFTGPVGLQCYGLTGDAREHLARSMAAWRQLNAPPAKP